MLQFASEYKGSRIAGIWSMKRKVSTRASRIVAGSRNIRHKIRMPSTCLETQTKAPLIKMPAFCYLRTCYMSEPTRNLQTDDPDSGRKLSTPIRKRVAQQPFDNDNQQLQLQEFHVFLCLKSGKHMTRESSIAGHRREKASSGYGGRFCKGKAPSEYGGPKHFNALCLKPIIGGRLRTGRV